MASHTHIASIPQLTYKLRLLVLLPIRTQLSSSKMALILNAYFLILKNIMYIPADVDPLKK